MLIVKILLYCFPIHYRFRYMCVVRLECLLQVHSVYLVTMLKGDVCGIVLS